MKLLKLKKLVEQEQDYHTRKIIECIMNDTDRYNYSCVRNNATTTRWSNYSNGKATIEETKEFTAARVKKQGLKNLNEKLTQIDRVFEAETPEQISIFTQWKSNRTWGRNPHTIITTEKGNYYGTASGCGYDKHSAAVSDALNRIDGILKAMYQYKEKNINNSNCDYNENLRQSDYNLSYGAGYGALPYFEGGVGITSTLSVLKDIGYKLITENHTKTTDFYYLENYIVKEVKHYDNK